ncbi:DUF3349 domain-containing protein [Luteipulveratus flavus]|uniref:DUF3349 domain-containing protein n=1 Tax=Luteipulveratus flavus TaxID=3031728 RepID=A0ABT6C7Q9_9MICO|nr:DUF3349 domain-containing protein [Luteipulveratus sp. YIM 133296]MDF8264900.1 DUF3349 domain-containing protein [Luteipulveratus sp. YIM 133296]
MSTGPLGTVLGWLRAGYPDGVPPKDFHPLLAILTRTLQPPEVEQVLHQLDHDHGGAAITDEHILAAIEDVKQAPPSEDDVRVVAARLAAVGWPLANGSTRLSGAPRTPAEGTGVSDVPSAEDRPAVLRRVQEWLRAGYPEGVPSNDYVPLLALLRRRLSDDEVKQICRELIAAEGGSNGPRSPISAVDAQVLITKVTQEMPAESDINRVRSRLAAKGWPLED